LDEVQQALAAASGRPKLNSKAHLIGIAAALWLIGASALVGVWSSAFHAVQIAVLCWLLALWADSAVVTAKNFKFNPATGFEGQDVWPRRPCCEDRLFGMCLVFTFFDFLTLIAKK